MTPWRGPPGCGGATRPWLRLALPPIPHCARESLTEAFAIALSEAQVPCRNRLRRRGVETRELPTKAAPNDPILVAAAATRGPGQAARARRRGGGTLAGTARRFGRDSGRATPIAGGGNSRLGRRPRFADPLRWPAPTPVRRRGASSFEKPGRASPFLVRRRRGQRHFRRKLRASAAADPQRTAPRRPKAPTTAAAAAGRTGVEDQNKSGDCRARARPLMSAGGTVARGGAQPRATGGQPPLVGRRAMARFLHR